MLCKLSTTTLFFHDWTKWKKHGDVSTWSAVTKKWIVTGKIQERECNRCGAVQWKRVKEV